MKFIASTIALIVLLGMSHAAEPVVDFNRDIRPILANNCFACHGPDEKSRKAELRLDQFDAAKETLSPGQPEKSEVLRRVSAGDADVAMPPAHTGKKLKANQIALLRAWVSHGATYAVHWSYRKPVRPSVPAFDAKNPIDAFLRSRLAKEGMQPSPEADRFTLIRRVSLDLTGLPPSVAEADAFATDRSPDAYEKMVDRMLAKPAFGEHWARMWLDLARYADSAGYADDPPRTIWLFRDYVIQSFNDNKPFDQFTIEQLAGDLLPKPTADQLIATAFHRNTMTNSEGGTSDEEFRNAAVVDRVNTTLAVWMGTSMACAQCHTHKYDPISQQEYFKFFALLNNTQDADRGDESPLFEPDDTPEKKAKRTSLNEVLAKLNAVKPDAEHVATHKKLTDDLKKWIADLQPKLSVPVMRELPEKQRRATRIQFRGNYLDLGDTVTPGVPAAFHPLPKGETANRLGMARWLVSPENPLTARVTVNRFWEQIYGIGLIRTVEEFGTQGELPSHPELLDWLAVEFIESKWDVKKLLRMIVTSAAYRQSAKVEPALLEKDPDNRLLARGPRFRVTAEMLRDQALAVSGLLSPKMHGPSVRPPQPSSGLSAAFGGGLDWKPSEGEDRYRRGIYTQWRRTNPYPSMAAFDAPSRESCSLRRIRTNTPLQALVTLNDPVYIEAAQSLARKTVAAGDTTDDKVRFAFRTCLTRPPTEAEVKRLRQLYDDARPTFAKDAKKAVALAGAPPKGVDVADLAAWTTVCNVLLNLDEMLMKR